MGYRLIGVGAAQAGGIPVVWVEDDLAWEWVPMQNRKPLPVLKHRMLELVAARETKDYAKADALRQLFLDEGAAVEIRKDRRVFVLY